MVGDSLFYLDRYLVGGDSKPLCCYNNPSEDCDLVILGSITREYQTRIGIYPNHEKFLLMSVTAVEATLKSLRIRFLGESANRMGGHASTCNFLPELFAKIAGSVTKIEGLKLEDFGSRQGLPIRRAATDSINIGLEDTYNPSLTCQFNPSLLNHLKGEKYTYRNQQCSRSYLLRDEISPVLHREARDLASGISGESRWSLIRSSFKNDGIGEGYC